MRQEIINLYSFDELSDRAKETARNNYRMHALDYEWWDGVYEDAERAGLKITSFDLGGRQSITGELTGDISDTLQHIMVEHGRQCDTYKLMQEFYWRRHIGDSMDEAEFTRQLLEEYRIMLDHEYEYLLSDECIDESLTANEYEFTENGEIH